MHGLEIGFYFTNSTARFSSLLPGLFLTGCCCGYCVGGGRFATLAEAAALPV
jgi:hypothetical protein